MKEEMSVFDKIFDDVNSDNIVLYNEKNEPIDFEQVAYIPIEENDYVILKPVVPFDNMKDDEAIVFAMEEGEDGEENLTVVVDDDVVDAVFAEYYRLFDESNKDEK